MKNLVHKARMGLGHWVLLRGLKVLPQPYAGVLAEAISHAAMAFAIAMEVGQEPPTMRASLTVRAPEPEEPIVPGPAGPPS